MSRPGMAYRRIHNSDVSKEVELSGLCACLPGSRCGLRGAGCGRSLSCASEKRTPPPCSPAKARTESQNNTMISRARIASLERPPSRVGGARARESQERDDAASALRQLDQQRVCLLLAEHHVRSRKLEPFKSGREDFWHNRILSVKPKTSVLRRAAPKAPEVSHMEDCVWAISLEKASKSSLWPQKRAQFPALI